MWRWILGWFRTDERPVTERLEEQMRSVDGRFPDVPHVTARELLDRRDRWDPVLVDVRSPAERAVSTLSGALSREQFEDAEASLSGRPVVVYCTIGVRSSKYVRQLMNRDVEASNMRGSILAWTHVGGELVGEEGEVTRRVHVFGSAWNLAAEEYDPTW
jgi:rhodanese-related sulfurtransferase